MDNTMNCGDYEREQVWDERFVPGETIISVRGVSLEYSGGSAAVPALADIDIDIGEGEFICLLGPSGCGKSTLLNLLAGFAEPTSGEVLMDGLPVKGPDWHRGVVFQQPALFPWLNVWKNAAFGLRMRKTDAAEIREKVDYYLEKVKLSEFRNHRVYELSGGMKQRLSIARVLAGNPVILLMDEPFGALDALTRAQMQTMLRNIWAETKKTIFFITHDVDEALSLATKVIVMSSRPGRFVKSFDTRFTFRFSGDQNSDVRAERSYISIREQILDLIITEHTEFSI
jgi:taurine transport system ATP-binding protein